METWARSEKPLRILHVVGRMDRGGVETWLMHVLRHLDRGRFHMDFLVHTTRLCAYDDEIRALGSKIIRCPSPSFPLTYTHRFKRALREHGPYDVVHSHVHHYSGYVLRLARQVGVPVRIAHSHGDNPLPQTKPGFLRRTYLALTKQWVVRHATVGLAASRESALALFGPAWTADPRWRILYCGIDLAPFHVIDEARTVRAEFGIRVDAFVIGHVGRFDEEKNHAFLIDIAAEVAHRDPAVRFLLVGDGVLRPEMEAKARRLKMEQNIIFAGLRSDVARLMLSAMDAFVFPSLREGLGLVLVEAQAAGLPCLIGDAIPEEADVVKSLIQRLSCSQPATVWAEALLAIRHTSPAMSRPAALTLVEQSPFNIRASTLTRLYASVTAYPERN